MIGYHFTSVATANCDYTPFFSLEGRHKCPPFLGGKIPTMPAKSLQHLNQFCLVLRVPLPLRTMLFCGKKIRMKGQSVTVLECWNNKILNKHCFGGEGGI